MSHPSVESITQETKCLRCVNPSTLQSMLLYLLQHFQGDLITADRTDITADNDQVLANQLNI